jgi:hypothetical protein
VDASLGGSVETTGEAEATSGAFDEGSVEAPVTIVPLSNAALVSAAKVGQLGSTAVATVRANLNIIMARGSLIRGGILTGEGFAGGC